jgi:hypothetical protein
MAFIFFYHKNLLVSCCCTGLRIYGIGFYGTTRDGPIDATSSLELELESESLDCSFPKVKFAPGL